MEPCRNLVSGYQSGVPIIRTVIFGGVNWGPLFWKLPYIDMLPHAVLGFRVLGCRVNRVCRAAQG